MAIKEFKENIEPRRQPVIKDRVVPVDPRFRNGVEIIGDIHVMRGMWQLTAQRVETYGQLSQENAMSGSFIDADRLSAQHLIERDIASSDERLMFDGQDFLGDGFIEPLTIRDAVTFQSVESPFISHSVKGQLMGGTDDWLLTAARIENIIDNDKTEALPFWDSGGDFGDDQLGKNMPVVGEIYDVQRKSLSFDETLSLHPAIITSKNFDTLMMSGTLTMKPDTNKYLPPRKYSATVGSTIEEHSLGTDSITYLR